VAHDRRSVLVYWLGGLDPDRVRRVVGGLNRDSRSVSRRANEASLSRKKDRPKAVLLGWLYRLFPSVRGDFCKAVPAQKLGSRGANAAEPRPQRLDHTPNTISDHAYAPH
jgi:hypothetical protein